MAEHLGHVADVGATLEPILPTDCETSCFVHRARKSLPMYCAPRSW